MCWIHPFFNCLGIEDEKLIISKSYNDETVKEITKGPNNVKMAQFNYKISTLINSLIECGFKIDKIIEENPIIKHKEEEYKSTFWNEKKLTAAPTTLIIVAKK